MPDINMNNVAIGDRFKVGKKTTAKVVDIREIKSMVTGLTTGYQCIAQGEGFITTNEFEVPFSTVVRNRIVSMAELQEMAEAKEYRSSSSIFNSNQKSYLTDCITTQRTNQNANT